MGVLPGRNLSLLAVLIVVLSSQYVSTQDVTWDCPGDSGGGGGGVNGTICWRASVPMSVDIDQQIKVQLSPRTSVELVLSSISSVYVYCTVQAHSNRTELTLSQTDPPTISTSWTSTDVGIVSRLSSGEERLTWFLFNNADSIVNTLVVASCYDKKAPLIGGCNHEFNMEDDANIHHAETSYITTITYQLSNVGTVRDARYNCDVTNTSPRFRLTYHVYVLYLESDTDSSLFDAMSKMISTENVTKYAVEVASYSSDDLTLKVAMTGFPHEGAIYTIVVNDPDNDQAAYFPATSYGCSDSSTECEYYSDHTIFSLVFVSLLGLVGVFLLTCGHRFLKIELFIFGYLMLAIVGYLIVSVNQDLPTMSCLLISAVVGLVGGCVYVFVWWRLGTPVITMAIVGVLPGLIISAIIMFTPFVNLPMWRSDSNYWLGVVVGSLLVCLFMVTFPKLVSIFSCSFIGSYLVTLPLDCYMGGHYKYIILLLVNHAAIPGFSSVITVVPFTETDIILTVVWGALCVCGGIFLFWRERKNPPFPPNPYRQWREDYESDLTYGPNPTPPAPPSPEVVPLPNERTPLVSRIT